MSEALIDDVLEMPSKSIQQVLDSEIDPRSMPEPKGYRILIEPIKIEEKTRGGLVLPSQSIEAKEHLRAIGRVMAMGSLCYQHTKFGDAGPWCEVGDWVVYNTYAGQERRLVNKSGSGYVAVRFINDDEVVAVLPDPTAVLIYV